MKKFLIIFLNIILIFFILYLFEFIIYKNEINKIPSEVVNVHKEAKFNHNFADFQEHLERYKEYFNGKDNTSRGRLPDGLKYKDKEPITIFGCSYGHGQYLEKNQTISYKLAHTLKRPVYNRSVVGGGLQHMYYQTTQDYFYKQVPASKDVIYIFIADHYRRMMVTSFDILDTSFLIHYHYKNDALVLENYDNKINTLIKSTYIYKYFNHKYVENYLNNSKNSEELTDLVLKYFIESRKNLEKNWNNKVNFTIILYDDSDITYKKLLTKKLEENNFQVFDTIKYLPLYKIMNEDYRMPDNEHPQEKVWTDLTPHIIKDLNL